MESSPASGGGVRSLANTSSTSAGQAQDVVLQSQVAEINRNMAALKERCELTPTLFRYPPSPFRFLTKTISLRGGQAQPSKPLTTFALQLPNKMLTVSLEEGYVLQFMIFSLFSPSSCWPHISLLTITHTYTRVTKELGQRAAREFAPLVAFLRTISSNTEQVAPLSSSLSLYTFFLLFSLLIKLIAMGRARDHHSQRWYRFSEWRCVVRKVLHQYLLLTSLPSPLSPLPSPLSPLPSPLSPLPSPPLSPSNHCLASTFFILIYLEMGCW